MQAWLRDCFTDDQLTTWLKCFHSSVKFDFNWAMSLIRTHAVQPPPQNTVVYRAEVRTVGVGWDLQRVGVWSLHGISPINICTRARVLFCQQRSLLEQWLQRNWYIFFVDIWRLITALIINILNEILWFCQRCIRSLVHIILLGCVEVWRFYPLMSVVYFFPDTLYFAATGEWRALSFRHAIRPNKRSLENTSPAVAAAAEPVFFVFCPRWRRQQ